MIFERYGEYKKIKDYCREQMKQHGIKQQYLANKYFTTQQNINYALKEPNRMQSIIYDIFLDMGFTITMTEHYIKIQK